MTARFLSRLALGYVAGNSDIKVVLEPFIYESDVAKETFTVPPGFKTDLASVPRLPVVFWLTGATADEAAVIHDYLYTTQIVSRKLADAVLREASAVSGVPGWRRGMMWAGVRLFGGSHWQGKPPPAPAS